MKTKAVLQELFDLLEAYAPAWYTEEQRERAAAALNYSDKPGLRLIKPLSDNQGGSDTSADSTPSRAPSSPAPARRIISTEAGAYLQ